jgi:NTE family protein
MTALKSALVLSGGGAYGAYEVGVIKALTAGQCHSTNHIALDPDIFVGTSVGSFNAAMLAVDKGGPHESIAALETVWREQVADKGDGRGNGAFRIRGNPVDYFDPRTPGNPLDILERLFADTSSLSKAAAPRLLHLLSPQAGIVERVENLVDISAFVDVDPFCQLVQKNLDAHSLRQSHKVLRVIATNWKKGTAHEFDFRQMTNEDIWSAIRASTAIPGLFPPVQHRQDTFVDGGVVQNTPIKPAIEAGADIIHVVSLNAKLSQYPQDHRENTIDTFSRVYSAMLSSAIAEDIESARWVNEGIEVMEKIEAGIDANTAALRQFTRVAGVIYNRLRHEANPLRSLTIHRYFPDRDLGDIFGMLNFHTSAIDALIEGGYADALAHNCGANGCVLAARHHTSARVASSSATPSPS